METCTYQVFESRELFPTDCLRDPGIKVVDDGTWSKHIHQLATVGKAAAAWLLSVFKIRSRKVMLTLYKSLVRSHLEYCCPLWHPEKIQDIQKLEGIQRTFTKMIAGLSNMNYWERLASPKLMSLQRRRERYIIIQLWKLLHRRPRLGLKAVVPSWENHSRAANRNLNKNYFAVVAPQVWSTLPVELNTIQTKTHSNTS